MATSRLTIDLPKSDIDFLKTYARQNKITVSELIDHWIKTLKPKTRPAIHPDIKKFTGIIPQDADVEGAIADHIMEKYK